jgi:DNA-binding beta-propeller fold protein YncE
VRPLFFSQLAVRITGLDPLPRRAASRCLLTAGAAAVSLALSATVATTPARAIACPAFGFLTKWGSEGSGNGQFDQPVGVATDSGGNVYVTDAYDHRVQKFSPSGAFITKWGSTGSGNGQFNNPWAVATRAAPCR